VEAYPHLEVVVVAYPLEEVVEEGEPYLRVQEEEGVGEEGEADHPYLHP
jgi:hypothetical protein